jgi:hypothetical protein
MSRVSLIEQLYAPKRKSALEFNYDNLWAPPIRFFLSQQDINELYKIATSLKYNDNIEKKYELIDAIMRPRGFKRGNCGTNRVVYNFLEDTSFCMKIALDRVGINDSPREYKNQEFFKPFCCKIFEVDPTGVIACVERVNPISSLEEFVSIADDVFNMMVTKIIGKYVIDDLGTEKFMNYGIRYNSNGIAFGPVVLDYPYAYELDGAKLRCGKPIQIGNKEFACGGEIDYDSGLNNLVCCKCGRTYSARELAKDDSNVLKFYSDDEQCSFRARIVRESDGTIIKDSGRSSKIYITKKEYEEGTKLFEVKDFGPRPVEKTIKKKYTPMKKLREEYYSELQLKAYQEMQKQNEEPVNTVIKSEFAPRPATRAKVKHQESEVIPGGKVSPYQYNETIRFDGGTPARRAEDLEVESKLPEESEPVKVIKEVTIDSFAVLPDGSIEPKLTNVEFETEENNDLTDGIAKMLNEVIDETTAEQLDTLLEIADYAKENDLFEDEEPIATYDESGIVDMTEEEYYGHKLEDDESQFSEEMEADVFPEISNKGIIVGVDMGEEPDYSNYEPSDEEADNYEDQEEVDYTDLFKENRKENKRNKKQQKGKTKKYIPDDMSDY